MIPPTTFDKAILFAVASERTIVRRGISQIVPAIIHVHAKSEGEARWIFSQDPDHRKSRIVAVGPVIGYHVEDEHGDVLTA